MSAEKIAELTLSLKDRDTKLAETTAKLTAAEKDLSDSTVKLADVSTALKEETAKREAAETEAKTLREWKAAEEQKAFDARLNDAFDTYKDERKLAEDDKEMMSLLLKSNPAKFEERFPKVTADKKHLLANLTDGKTGPAETQIDDGQGVKVIDMAEAARKLARGKGISIGEAQRILARNAKR